MIGRDPKTRRLIVTDLTPSHKDKTTGVHGVGEVFSKEGFDDYKGEQEEKHFFRDLLVKAILSLVLGTDWTEVDLEEIDWEKVASSEIDLTGLGGIPVLDEVRLIPKASSSGPEGTMFYDSDDDHVYVGTE